MDSFAPGAELLFGLGQGWVLFGDNADPALTPTQFKVTARYSFSGKEVTETTNVDLRPYLSTEGAADALVEELESIRGVLERWTTK